jgi:hypothetical protein
MNALAAVLVLFLCPLLAHPQAEARQSPRVKKDIPSITRQATKAVALVVAYDQAENPIAQGSGFVVSSVGQLVTNYHVIDGAASVVAKFPNGAFYPVDGILAVDVQKDLAVLKLSGSGFEWLPLADSSKALVGEAVLAIGSPLALEATVSNGIISAIRELEGENFTIIQTTAPISRGSSGGALLNENGEVLGVTSFQLVKGENLNFAVSAEHIKPLLNMKEVMPFVPKAPKGPREVERKEDDDDTFNLASLPREWIFTGDASTVVTVRVEGEYIYQMFKGKDRFGSINSLAAIDISYDVICETKRAGSEWKGKCRHTVTVRSWPTDARLNSCTFELEQTLKAVLPRRIEGENQGMKWTNVATGCPYPVSERTPFSMIPRF